MKSWPAEVHGIPKSENISVVATIPDAGLTEFLAHFDADKAIDYCHADKRGGRYRVDCWLGTRRQARDAGDAKQWCRQLYECLVSDRCDQNSLSDACDDARPVGRVQPLTSTDGKRCASLPRDHGSALR